MPGMQRSCEGCCVAVTSSFHKMAPSTRREVSWGAAGFRDPDFKERGFPWEGDLPETPGYSDFLFLPEATPPERGSTFLSSEKEQSLNEGSAESRNPLGFPTPVTQPCRASLHHPWEGAAGMWESVSCASQSRCQGGKREQRAGQEA